jgi:formylglycine-generating enzyme required for sulfatase activity
MHFRYVSRRMTGFSSYCEIARLCGICLLAAALLAFAGGCVNQGPLREPPFVPEELNEMVRIPAGKFIMGAEAPDFPKAMGPAHEVHTDEFLLAKYPVTNCQYKKYMDATGAAAPPHWVDGWYPEDREYHRST